MIKRKINSLIKNNKKINKYILGKFIKIHNYSYHKISEYAASLNDGIHPKWKIIDYHNFFLSNIKEGDTVLDIGCGSGFVAYNVAKKAGRVVGIDKKKANIENARERFRRENLEFIVRDATQYNFKKFFDNIILSNVLEHIEHRVELLRRLRSISNIILLRVPMISRSWLAVYKKNNGYEYRTSLDHFIEYTFEDLKKELDRSGWKLESYQINWGELWGVLIKRDE